MAYSASPLANTPTKSPAYNDATYTSRSVAVTQVGGSNTSYVVYAAAVPSVVYQTTFTPVVVSGVAAGTLQCYLISANNGVNVSSNILLGNTVTIGANVAGNVQTTGPFGYNTFANGANSGANSVRAGGVTLNVGDVIIAVSTLNAGIVAAATEYSIAPTASLLS